MNKKEVNINYYTIKKYGKNMQAIDVMEQVCMSNYDMLAFHTHCLLTGFKYFVRRGKKENNSYSKDTKKMKDYFKFCLNNLKKIYPNKDTESEYIKNIFNFTKKLHKKYFEEFKHFYDIYRQK